MYYLLIFEEFFYLVFLHILILPNQSGLSLKEKVKKNFEKKKQKETLFLNIWQITVDLNMLGRVGS